MTKYNHAFDIAFEIVTDEPEGNVTEEQVIFALIARVMQLSANDELLEAVGAPFDTYKI